jgi:hypothetical protein
MRTWINMGSFFRRPNKEKHTQRHPTNEVSQQKKKKDSYALVRWLDLAR